MRDKHDPPKWNYFASQGGLDSRFGFAITRKRLEPRLSPENPGTSESDVSLASSIFQERSLVISRRLIEGYKLSRCVAFGREKLGTARPEDGISHANTFSSAHVGISEQLLETIVGRSSLSQ